MLSLLVVNGYHAESPEGDLVADLAKRSQKFSRIETASRPTPQQLRRRWSLVWVCSHVTVRRTLGTATFEERVGGRYRVIAQASAIVAARCSLLVLSGCHTSRPEVCAAAQQSYVVTHVGKVYLHDSLTFAASFMWMLGLHARASRLTHDVVQAAFDTAAPHGAYGYALRSTPR